MMENNVRPIDANALKKVVNETINRMYALRIDSVGPYADFLDKIDMQPTIDLETLRPVGRWVEIRNAYGELEGWIHADCGREVKCKENYCPNCGAKMEG